MGVPGLGVESELWLLAYTTSTATGDLSPICDLCHSLRYCWILNPWARPGIKPTSPWILIRFLICWATRGTPPIPPTSEMLVQVDILLGVHLIQNRTQTSFIYFIFVYFFIFLRATPEAYGSSQARARIRPIAASLCHSHSNARSKQATSAT